MAVPKRDGHCRIEAASSTLKGDACSKRAILLEVLLEVLLGARYGVSIDHNRIIISFPNHIYLFLDYTEIFLQKREKNRTFSESFLAV